MGIENGLVKYVTNDFGMLANDVDLGFKELIGALTLGCVGVGECGRKEHITAFCRTGGNRKRFPTRFLSLSM